MAPPTTHMYTLISMYLWSGFVSSECFFPDDSKTEELQAGYQPCNSTTEGQASACCQLSTSACTTMGYCSGNTGYAYRGACTDPDFQNPCAQNCVDGEKCPRTICTHMALMSRSLKVSKSLPDTIFRCGAEGGLNDSFCCGYMLDDPWRSSGSCCNESITGFEFGTPFVPLSYAEAQASASSATTSSSSTLTIIGNAPATSPPLASSVITSPTNPSSSSSSSHSAAFGAGIGVPLGVALLLSLGFLFYREHKQRLKLESLLGDNLPRGKQDKISQVGAMDGMPYELGGDYAHELNSNPIHEANGTS